MRPKYLLQLGLAITLLYAGFDALLHPFDWVGFVPTWVTAFHISRETFLHIHSVSEIILGGWLLSNRAIRLAALLTALDILAIIVFSGFNRAVFTTTFRDVSIFFTALYLVISV